MKVLGIDPGMSGALAQWDGEHLAVHDMPVADKQLDMAGICDLFDISFSDAEHCYLEKVSAMPGQGVSSTFKFGSSYGAAKMAVLAFRIPLTEVTPVKWKLDMGLSNDKEKSRARALALFPKFSHQFARKKDDGRAEAALLAYYGWFKLTGKGELR
jgi:hypothetical protein